MSTMLQADILQWLAVFSLVLPGFSQTDWHFEGPDIAQGKIAFQGPDTFLQYYPTLAVDGVIDTNIEHNHCSHTGDSTNAWWSVELGKPFVVKGIRIYNRSNNLGRLKDFRIVGNPGDVELYNDGKADVPRYLDIEIEITVDIATAFDEIDVEIPGPYLTLCEVQVYTELCKVPQLPASSPLKYRIIADMVYSGYIPVGGELLFHCEPRIQYVLVGSANQTCHADGSYTDQLPTCEPYCPTLPDVVNGEYTNVKSSYNPGDFLWFTCDSNFAPRSDSKQACTTTSTWSNPSPGCSPVKCSSPGQFANGHYVLSTGTNFPIDGVNVGTNISVVCDTKAFVAIFPNRTCLSDGSWTGKGQCTDANDINCSLESLRPTERFYVLDKPYGSSIGYNQSINAHCEQGYMITSGEEFRTCLANGTLSGTELLCNASTCATETLDPKDRFYFFDDKYGQAVAYTTTITTFCRPGYVWRSGDFTRTCLTNGSFNGTELLCSSDSSTCATETLDPKDRFYFFDDKYGQAVAYTTTITTFCRPGYVRRSGNFTRACLTNGSFSGTELLCSPYDSTCVTEALHPKDRFYFLDVNYGPAVAYTTTITTFCRPGYVWSSGNFTRTCLTNGSLSGTELLCSPHSGPQSSNAESHSSWAIAVFVGVPSWALLIAVTVRYCKRSHYWQDFYRRGIDSVRGFRRRRRNEDDNEPLLREARQHQLSSDSPQELNENNEVDIRPRRSSQDQHFQVHPPQRIQRHSSLNNDRTREYGATAFTEASVYSNLSSDDDNESIPSQLFNTLQGRSSRFVTSERSPSRLTNASSMNRCAVCWDNDRNCCLSCGHLLCDNCAHALVQSSEPCPQCRAAILDMRMLFPGSRLNANGQLQCGTGLCHGRDCDCCLDCGHMLCLRCASELEGRGRRGRRCPMCHQRFTDVWRIYY